MEQLYLNSQDEYLSDQNKKLCSSHGVAVKLKYFPQQAHMISWNREEPERSLSSMMDLCFEHDVNALSVSYPHSHLDAQYVRASLERLGFVCNDRVDLGVLHETDPKFHTEGEPRHFFKSGILSDSKYYQQQKQKPIGSLIFPEQERQKRQEREAEEQAYVENLLDGYKPPANSLLGAKEPRLVFRNVGFTFDSRLAPQVHEQKPRIHFFLTGVPTEVDASSMYVLDLNLDGSDTTGTLDFELPLDREVVRRYGLDRVFLNMHCYTEVPNERGDYCLNQAGYARAPLVLLLEQAKKNPGDMRTKKAAFELIVPAKPDLVKGVIEFDVSPTLSLVQFESPKTGERSDKRLLKRRVFLYPEEEETDAKRDRNALIAVRQQQQQGGLPRYERNLKDYHRLVSQYVEQVYKRYMRIQPTWKAIENIHAFQFVSPIGILPAAVFHRFPGAPKSSVAFWVNLVNVALGRIRDDWSWAKEVREGRVPRSAEEFGARDWSTDLDAEDPLEARLSSCVLSIVMTLYVNSCQYITDKIDTRNRKEPAYKREEERLREFERRSNRNGMWRSWKQLRYLSGSPNWIGQRQIVDEAEIPNSGVEAIESFDEIRMRDVGDCEDFGKESLLEWTSLRRVYREHKRHNMSLHGAVRRLYETSRHYYAIAILAGVAGQHINQDYSQVKSLGGHEYAMLFPKWYFYECLMRGAHDSDSSENEQLNEPFLARRKDSKLGKQYPVRVCEGTGMLWPEGTGDEFHVLLTSEVDRLRSQPNATDRDKRRLEQQLKYFSEQQAIAEHLLSSSQMLRDLRRIERYSHETGSDFYATISTGFTNEFFAKRKAKDNSNNNLVSGVGEFMFVYNNPPPEHQGKWSLLKQKVMVGASVENATEGKTTYGVRFTDVIHMSDKVAILAQYPFSETLSEYFDDVQLDQHPIRELPAPTQVVRHHSNTLDDRVQQATRLLKEEADKLYRLQVSSSNKRLPALLRPISITRFINYVHCEEYHIREILSAIEQLSVRLEGRPVSLSVIDEPITTNQKQAHRIGTYRLVFRIE